MDVKNATELKRKLSELDTRVLVELLKGSKSQSAISKALGEDRGKVSTAGKHLEQLGFVERRKEGKGMVLEPTERGKSVAEAFHFKSMRPVNPSDCEALEHLIRQVNERAPGRQEALYDLRETANRLDGTNWFLLPEWRLLCKAAIEGRQQEGRRQWTPRETEFALGFGVKVLEMLETSHGWRATWEDFRAGALTLFGNREEDDLVRASAFRLVLRIDASRLQDDTVNALTAVLKDHTKRTARLSPLLFSRILLELKSLPDEVRRDLRRRLRETLHASQVRALDRVFVSLEGPTGYRA